MKKNQINWKQDKGITTADIAIAVIILMIFVALIANAFYNYYLAITSKNRSAIATNCAIDVIEQVKKMNYEDINTQTVEQVINQLKSGLTLSSGNTITIPEPYNVTATVKNYNETEGNSDKQDYIKILTVTVEYIISDKTQQIQMSKVITK